MVEPLLRKGKVLCQSVYVIKTDSQPDQDAQVCDSATFLGRVFEAGGLQCLPGQLSDTLSQN